MEKIIVEKGCHICKHSNFGALPNQNYCMQNNEFIEGNPADNCCDLFVGDELKTLRETVAILTSRLNESKKKEEQFIRSMQTTKAPNLLLRDGEVTWQK